MSLSIGSSSFGLRSSFLFIRILRKCVLKFKIGLGRWILVISEALSSKRGESCESRHISAVSVRPRCPSYPYQSFLSYFEQANKLQGKRLVDGRTGSVVDQDQLAMLPSSTSSPSSYDPRALGFTTSLLPPLSIKPMLHDVSYVVVGEVCNRDKFRRIQVPSAILSDVPRILIKHFLFCVCLNTAFLPPGFRSPITGIHDFAIAVTTLPASKMCIR